MKKNMLPVKYLSDKNCPLKSLTKYPLFRPQKSNNVLTARYYPPAKKVIPVKYPTSANYPNTFIPIII